MSARGIQKGVSVLQGQECSGSEEGKAVNFVRPETKGKEALRGWTVGRKIVEEGHDEICGRGMLSNQLARKRSKRILWQEKSNHRMCGICCNRLIEWFRNANGRW